MTASDKKTCPVCSTEIDPSDELVICPDCQMAYHKDCWEENNGCATYGCPSAGCLNPPPMQINVDAEGGNVSDSNFAQFQNDENFPCPYCQTMLSQGSTICWSCGKEIKNNVNVTDCISPGPWTRWTARQIDLILETFFVGVLFSIIGVSNNTNEILANIIYGPFVILLDSAVYAICGNTLGKWLMGIKIVKLTGNVINGGEYFKRNWRVYWGGFGLNIPIVALCTFLTQYNRIKKRQEATYDEILQMKSVRHNSNCIKSFFGVILLILMLLGLAVLSTIPEI